MKPSSNDLSQNTFRMIAVGIGLTGCVTVLIIGIAIFVGLSLDKTFGSAKHLFTFGTIILSIPVTLLGLLWVTRFTSARFMPPDQEQSAQENSIQEDADSV